MPHINYGLDYTLVLSETEKTDECKWFTKEELLEHQEINPEIRNYAFKALESII